jgi:hypothetical protein
MEWRWWEIRWDWKRSPVYSPTSDLVRGGLQTPFNFTAVPEALTMSMLLMTVS